MLNVVYELNLGGNLRYIGITHDLNERLEVHIKYWKQEEGIKVQDIKVLFFGTMKLCRHVEASRIKEDTTGLLMNKAGYTMPASLDRVSSRVYEDIPTPIEVMEGFKKATDKVKYMRKKLSVLETKYMSEYMMLVRVKNNLDNLDAVVEEALYAEVRK